MTRRERTRSLIELGWLVQKAGLARLADDDRTMLYGAFLDLAARMRDEGGAPLCEVFRQCGAHALATEAEDTEAVGFSATLTKV
ncbi:conjugal transfer protein TraD [Sphingomonas sp. CL5.1]|uniref:conjugal transfer protein TraD n=1 Tax=Sphingomonas sp. CL5.1 TaxID=2653203 RepID=UPI0015836359|nr:conjugal transfer protein TraD [Sphingomonas sp. CL5.1]QKR98284.1 conjugal transfer protein TraD [Sphingomonas sp. CL5.1]